MVRGSKSWPATSGEPVHGVVVFYSSNSSSSTSLSSDSSSTCATGSGTRGSASAGIAAFEGRGFLYEAGGFVG